MRSRARPAQPQVLEIPLKLTESKTRLFMFRERGSHDSDAAASRLFAEAKQRNGMGPELALWIDWIEVAGKASATLPADKPQKLRKDPEQWANQYMPIYAKATPKKYERYQKWCAAIDEAAKKPENAEVVDKLRADPRLKTQPHLFYNGFAQIQGAPAPSQFGFATWTTPSSPAANTPITTATTTTTRSSPPARPDPGSCLQPRPLHRNHRSGEMARRQIHPAHPTRRFG